MKPAAFFLGLDQVPLDLEPVRPVTKSVYYTAPEALGKKERAWQERKQQLKRKESFSK